jgi:hypothetical protein
VIDRELALRILGLSADAGEIEIQNAYRALREHLRARLAASDSAVLQQARRDELRDLERVMHALSAVPIPRAAAQGSPGRLGGPASAARGSWIFGWAVLATLSSVALLAYLVSRPDSFGPAVLFGSGDGNGGAAGGFAIDGAPPVEEQGSSAGEAGQVESAGARAQLVARSAVEGAVLRVESRGEVPELVAEGAADETVYWLSPGSYGLRVAHPDCADGWERELTVRGGEHHEFAPELCRETGWVVVRSNQTGDVLSIDGREIGATNAAAHPLPAGEHEVRVEKTGFEPWEGLVEVSPGEVLAIRPRLARRAGAKQKEKKQQQDPPAVAASQRTDPGVDERFHELGGWHQEATQWLLARYDSDRSGRLDSRDELHGIPCEQWLSLEQSYDDSGLGLSLTRFYGFDGERWRSNALGVSDEVRDIAYQRMKECGLR